MGFGAPLKHKLSQRLVMLLLALPFTAVGLGFLVLSVLPTLMDARQMQHWHQGQAQLTHAELKVNRSSDSTTYEALASYGYTYQGTEYTGSRVAINSGADNIGDFQQHLAHRLLQAYGEGHPVDVYINPDNPAEAVLNRELRWSLLAFKLVFVLAFGGVGVAILLYLLLAKPSATGQHHPDKPWLSRREWASAEVKCNGKIALWGAWVFALVWNVIAIAIGAACVAEFIRGDKMALWGLLLPAAGVAILAWAIVQLRAYRRFGAAPLQLDPYPGSIGGQVGGVIEVNLPYDRGANFAVCLSCTQIYYTGSGKNRSRRESLVWQAEGYADTRATGISASKTRLEILFNVPEGLPASEAPSNRFHVWRLSVRAEIPGADFNRRYELPVFATATGAVSLRALSSDSPLQQQASEKAIGEVLDIRQIAGGVVLDNPALRRPGARIIGLFIGAVFIGAGWVMYVQSAPLFFTMLAFVVGIPAVIYSAYSLLLRLQVQIDAACVQIQKSILGVKVGSHSIDRAKLAGLALKESYSSSNGQQHRVFYVVQAVTHEGKKHTLVRNLLGRTTAEQVLESLSLLTGIPRQ